MGFFSRLMMVLRAKSNAALKAAENPIEVLDYVDDQQRENLRRLKQGIIEVAVSKRQLRQHVESLEKRIPELEEQARQAVKHGREDLAMIALERKQTVTAELQGLVKQAEDVEREEQKLVAAEHRLSARIDEFRSRRRTLAARYSAAEAQVAVKENLAGVSGDFAELHMALGRAEEKIDYMINRASAVDDLIDSGGYTSLTTSTMDIVGRELTEITARHAIEDELKELRAALPAEGSLNGKDS